MEVFTVSLSVRQNKLSHSKISKKNSKKNSVNSEEPVSCPVNVNASIKINDSEMHRVLLPTIWIYQVSLKTYIPNDSFIMSAVQVLNQ